jgi:hypothetical protein
MENAIRPVECIVFMLIQDGQVLTEKRKPTKREVPGVIALSGGHMEAQENSEQALSNEMDWRSEGNRGILGECRNTGSQSILRGKSCESVPI